MQNYVCFLRCVSVLYFTFGQLDTSLGRLSKYLGHIGSVSCVKKDYYIVKALWYNFQANLIHTHFTAGILDVFIKRLSKTPRKHHFVFTEKNIKLG